MVFFVCKYIMNCINIFLEVADWNMDEAYFTNAAVTTLGAILNRDDCRKTIVCNACNAVKSLVPIAQVGVVLADHYMPPDIRNWDKYAVAKRVFFNDRMERCEEIYHCTFNVGQWDHPWDRSNNAL